MLEPIMGTLSSKRIVLGSSLASRAELLKELGLNFTVVEPTYDDSLSLKTRFWSKCWYVKDAAYQKLVAVEKSMKEQNIEADITISAFTAVIHGDVIYGKPETPEETVTFLKALNGKRHQVFTGACLRANGRLFIFSRTVSVLLAKLSDSTINAYAQTGEYLDKIGVYGVYGKGGTFVKHIDGQLSALFGLPVYDLCNHLLKVYSVPEE